MPVLHKEAVMILSKYLDPRNDVAFKKIFGTEKNKDILMHFLNNILDSFNEVPITKIELLSTTLLPKINKKKLSIVDVLCKDKTGVIYIIEMQVLETKGFEKRVLHYSSKVYSDQAKKGDEYQVLKKVVFITIANYIIFPDSNDTHYKSEHAIYNKKTREQSLKDLCYIFIELPKFDKTKEKLSSIEEKWCYFFKHASETTEEDLQSIIGNDKMMEKAYAALNQHYWSKEELMSYERAKQARMDHKAILQYKLDEGEAKGLKKGIEQGIEKGKVELAKKLLQNGVGMDFLIQSADLSKKQVEELKKYILEEKDVVNF